MKTPELNYSQDEILTILTSLLEANISPKHKEQIKHYIDIARRGVEITLGEATNGVNLFSK